jgi:hypothetical protein
MVKNIKSQAEIMGIAIVMVLIMLGIVFVIRFVVLPEDINVKKSYDQTQMAANFLSSAVKTTTECNRLTITELIQDCSENYGNNLALYKCPDNMNSCQFLNYSMEILLNASLNIMPQVNYDLLICKWDDYNRQCSIDDSSMLSNFSKNGCLGRRIEYESQQHSLPTDVGVRVVQMYIC